MSLISPFVVLMFSAAMISLSGLSAASANDVEKPPAAKWDFESDAGLAAKGCAILAEPGRGKCLKLVSPSSRATVETTAALPDVVSPKGPYTLTIWLKPDKSVISDADVEMAKFGGRRMTKFASAMHDGKWHHLAVTYDPARTNAEYAAYVDWPDEKSPWRFMSFYSKDAGMSKCILPFSFGSGKAVFGGKVGMSLFSVGYSGMIDDVTIYNRALTDDEVRCMATNTNLSLRRGRNACRRGGIAAFPSHFSAVKLFSDLRLDLRFVWYNGCEF